MLYIALIMKVGISILIIVFIVVMQAHSQVSFFLVNDQQKPSVSEFIPGFVLVSAFFINSQVAKLDIQNKQLTKVAIGTAAGIAAIGISIKLQREHSKQNTYYPLLPYSGGEDHFRQNESSPPEPFKLKCLQIESKIDEK